MHPLQRWYMPTLLRYAGDTDWPPEVPCLAYEYMNVRGAFPSVLRGFAIHVGCFAVLGALRDKQSDRGYRHTDGQFGEELGLLAYALRDGRLTVSGISLVFAAGGPTAITALTREAFDDGTG